MSGARYFLRDDGSVLTAANVFDVALWESSDIYTEVRIVPADAIVIERSELPAVTVDGRHGFTAGGLLVDSETTADDAIWAARCHLAVAEYLTANPPVDEAQVSALRAVLLDARVSGVVAVEQGSDEDRGDVEYVIARRLIATGRVQVTS